MLVRIILATITTVALSGCHLFIGAFVAAKGYEKRDIPPKIEDPPGWSSGHMTKRNRFWIWAEPPRWHRMDHAYRDGKYRYTRRTSNHPMVYVFRERDMCRWTRAYLEQRRASEGPDDRAFTERDTYFIETGTEKHYEVDCKKLKKLLAPDPRYAAILPKL